MKNELAMQKELCDSAKQVGGFGMKLSHRFCVGVSDIFLSVPYYPISFFEIKFLGDVADTFSRKTGITPIQQNFLNRLNSTQPHAVAAQIVFVRHLGFDRVVMVPGHADRLDHNYERGEAWLTRGKNKNESRWDVETLLKILRRDPAFKVQQ